MRAWYCSCSRSLLCCVGGEGEGHNTQVSCYQYRLWGSQYEFFTMEGGKGEKCCSAMGC